MSDDTMSGDNLHPWSTRLARDTRAMGLALPAQAPERLARYVDELARWNRTYNLTSVRDPAAMLTTHVLDSLSALPHVRGPVADIGSGGGLPGLVLAVADPALAVTSVESVGKKTRFQRHVARTLALDNVTVVDSRVEHFQSEGGFATVICRAYTSLSLFCASTRHLLAPDGRWLAMKGRVPTDEIQGLDDTVQVESVIELTVPGIDAARCLIVMREVR